MNIALYHPWLKSRGGSERVVLEIVKDLKEHSFDIYTNYYDKNNTFPEFGDMNIVSFSEKKPTGFLSRGLFGFFSALKKIDLQKYDLFIVSTSGIGELTTIRNNKIPTMCYCHTLLRPANQLYDYYKDQYNWYKRIIFMISVKIYKMLEKNSWKNFKLIVCNSSNIKENIIKSKLATKNKTHVVSPGVDIEKFNPTYKEKKYFLVPGRFKPYKRFELAIEAFENFEKKYKNFELIIVGNADDKEYYKKIKRYAKKNIKIFTNIDDDQFVKFYQNCFAVLLTAKNEDFGIVSVEAQACGKPVIAVNEGGFKETVIDGKTGFLTEAKASSVAEHMLILVKNSNLRKEMSKNARKNATKYSWKNFSKKMEVLIEKCIS